MNILRKIMIGALSTTLGLALMGILVGALTGCDQNNTPPADTRPDFVKGLPFGEVQISNLVSKANSIENYLGVEVRRHGLAYFPYTGDAFKAAFEKYFDAHPELEPVSGFGDSESRDCGYNYAVSRHAGYFVLTRKKPAETK